MIQLRLARCSAPAYVFCNAISNSLLSAPRGVVSFIPNRARKHQLNACKGRQSPCPKPKSPKCVRRCVNFKPCEGRDFACRAEMDANYRSSAYLVLKGFGPLSGWYRNASADLLASAVVQFAQLCVILFLPCNSPFEVISQDRFKLSDLAAAGYSMQPVLQLGEFPISCGRSSQLATISRCGRTYHKINCATPTSSKVFRNYSNHVPEMAIVAMQRAFIPLCGVTEDD